MSWGGGEFSTETSYDPTFAMTNVVFFAAAGDAPGTLWPCVSVNVVCAGGTSIRRSYTSSFTYYAQATWQDTGGGFSLYEPRPSYQPTTLVGDTTSTKRAAPDLSFDANPYSGVWVWDSNYFEELGGGWFFVGGTSLSSPALAGIVNNAATRAASFATNSATELTKIYADRAVSGNFAHPTYASLCGPYLYYGATTVLGDWDACDGIGYPIGYVDK